MTNYAPLKGQKLKKILLIALSLMLLGGLVTTYLYMSSAIKKNNKKIVATNTPKVSVSESTSTPTTASGPTLSITPETIQQGEPALITVEGVTSTSSVKSFTFNGRRLVTFLYKGQVTALLGINLRAAPGTFPLVLTLNDGRQSQQNFVIKERVIVRVPFGIPEKLGGNTPEAEKELISTLVQEGKIINAIPTSNEKLWSENFGLPLTGPLVVEDIYGYTRITGNSTLSHKGTDLRAPIGTPVYAMNRGLVRFTDYLRNYGNAVVIDHGLGLQTVYMHLSKISVNEGQMVEKGDLIGMSGDTGYVLSPHLHLSVRIWGVAVDPMKFLELLGSEN